MRENEPSDFRRQPGAGKSAGVDVENGRRARLTGPSVTIEALSHMHEEVSKIELVHSAWIDYERAGDLNRLLALCADDVEFWPPNALPVIGREEVTRYLDRSGLVIHDIKVSDHRIRVSQDFAYLTAKYQTTFTAQDEQTTTTVGSHLWILRKHGDHWIVVLVAWSVWA